jgi:hypothetical protein
VPFIFDTITHLRITTLVFANERPRSLHCRYTRTDTYVRWGFPVKYIAVISGRFTSETAVLRTFHFRNPRSVASEVKPPFGGFGSETATWIRKLLKHPLELLGTRKL